MPTYEYHCDACGLDFERDQRITEDPLKTCPSCKARKARRLISRTSFVLKGSGWYSDLYSSKSAEAKDDGSGKKDESKDKPGTQAEPKPKTASGDSSPSKGKTPKGKKRPAA